MHDVGPEQIFVANGSNEVLQTVLLTFAGAGRTVATFEPTYQLHGHLARLFAARRVVR
jgi:histidinol-phosphate aminotransferase